VFVPVKRLVKPRLRFVKVCFTAIFLQHQNLTNNDIEAAQNQGMDYGRSKDRDGQGPSLDRKDEVFICQVEKK
jgi:hypothetical protein